MKKTKKKNIKKNQNKKKKEHPHPMYRKVALTFGQKFSDKLTTFCGSWAFIILVFIFMAIWISLNVYAMMFKWDPYPFILLNFVLSCLAAIQAPIILMSQNREAQRDRIRAKYDYKVNLKAEKEIRSIQRQLSQIKKHLMGKKR